MSLAAHLILWLLALAGAASIGLALMLAAPLRFPPTLASILDGAMQIDAKGLPEFSRFQARDGTWLAYRVYPAASGARDRLAILAHGSAGASNQMHPIARALANAGVAAAAVDFRGHGASGTRGDVAYSGQLDDDLADLIAELRAAYPDARFVFIGHSSGGGYGLRVAAGPLRQNFDRFVLLAPYLGHRAPTTRPPKASESWASADVPRIVAILLLERLGVDGPQSLPVLAFATAPEAKKAVTDRYSFRLMQSYAAPDDWKGAFEPSRGRISVLVGADDKLMDAEAFARIVPPLGARVTIVPGVDHMGLCFRPEAIKAIVAALNEPGS